MIDVVLAVLDEAAALPSVLAMMPAGYRPRAGRSKVSGSVRGSARAVGGMAAVLR